MVVSSLARDIAATCEKVQFYDLEVLNEYEGQTDDTYFIEFKFKCKTKGQKGFRMSDEEVHRETSMFQNVGGSSSGDVKWLFRDGVSQQEKVA